MAGIAAEHRAAAGDARPRLDYPPYRGTALRHPQRPPLAVEPEGAERGAPCFGERDVDPADADLTSGHAGEPIGERIAVAGRLLDGAGRAPSTRFSGPLSTPPRAGG